MARTVTISSGKARPRLTRRAAIRIHRWLGIAACAFWLLQAVTGMLSVFHWELEDEMISSVAKPTDLRAIQRTLDALAPPHSSKTVSMVWTTAGLPDRYDVWVADAGARSTAVVRIAGDGQVLRRKQEGDGNFFSYVSQLHQSLGAGKYGRWFIGFSGILLITNVLLGLRGALPKKGLWKAALQPRSDGSRRTRLFSWHRALGLWFTIPAVLLFSVGAGLAYKDQIGAVIGAHAPSVAPEPKLASQAIELAAAVEIAFKATHSERLTAVEMPTAENAVYQIRVLGSGELRRAIGTTRVFVSANDGAVRGVFPPSSQVLPQRFINTLYSFHTGEAGGLAGRLLVLAIGCWLATMIVLGLSMRNARRRNASKGSVSAK